MSPGVCAGLTAPPGGLLRDSGRAQCRHCGRWLSLKPGSLVLLGLARLSGFMGSGLLLLLVLVVPWYLAVTAAPPLVFAIRASPVWPCSAVFLKLLHVRE